MTIFRVFDRGGAQRVAVVDAFVLPSGVRERVGSAHPRLSFDDLSSVVSAGRQWFRLVARHPRAKMSMPSVVVDALWRELARHERDYAEFSSAAFGRPFPYASPEGALAVTYRHAREDEPGERLPLLFRVDKELAVPGGRHYIRDCGGRGECFTVPGAVCLQHLSGPGKPGGWNYRRSSDVPPGAACSVGGM